MNYRTQPRLSATPEALRTPLEFTRLPDFESQTAVTRIKSSATGSPLRRKYPIPRLVHEEFLRKSSVSLSRIDEHSSIVLRSVSRINSTSSDLS